LPVGTLSVADRTPGVVVPGVNVTPIWQLFPAATEFGVQEAGAEKSSAFGPEIAIPEISAAAPPAFKIVALCGALVALSL
jgi:hypothetical protein